MRRREFITLVGRTAVASPLAARAQQPAPIIGFLNSASTAPFTLNRPGGNTTGVSMFADVLGAKRIELLRELVPNSVVVGLLIDLGSPDQSKRQLSGAIIALTAQYGIPTMYQWREYTMAGGLVSCGESLADAYREVGVYADRILKGEKPADLPVLRPTKFEFVINVKTTKALGLAIPDKLLALADEVIE